MVCRTVGGFSESAVFPVCHDLRPACVLFRVCEIIHGRTMESEAVWRWCSTHPRGREPAPDVQRRVAGNLGTNGFAVYWRLCLPVRAHTLPLSGVGCFLFRIPPRQTGRSLAPEWSGRSVV